MHIKPLFIFIALLSFSCTDQAGSSNKKDHATRSNITDTTKDNPYAHISDIPLPGGFERIPLDSGSFGAWLRKRELKKDKTVYLYNGEPKYNQDAQFAVLNISVGDRDLQQCADAVMRLRAEWFFERKAFDSINFIDNANTRYHFLPPYTRANFTKYLNRVFGMCGSASLAKQLKPQPSFSAMKPGDVIIRGGFPGHAVLVMDMAVNAAGEKIYMLAQSYMPAQDIHVLKNPNNEPLSPWYALNANPTIVTPEYVFDAKELKRW